MRLKTPGHQAAATAVVMLAPLGLMALLDVFALYWFSIPSLAHA